MRDMLRGRMTARLDWEASLARSGLPVPAQEIVAQVVKRTKLWRLEKTEVCNELAAHFGDGLAAGETTEELLKNFGDIRQTAQLIRRAKKRQRPLVWHGLKWIGRGFLALVVVYVGLTVYYAMDRVVIKTDYLAQINAVAMATPESERAWPVYREVLMGWDELWEKEQYTEVDGQEQPVNFTAVLSNLGFGNDKPIHPGTPAWQLMIQELNAHAKDIKTLRQAAANPHMGFVMGAGGYQPEDLPFFSRENQSENLRDGRPTRLRSELPFNTPLLPHEALNGASLGLFLSHFSAFQNRISGVLIADMERATFDRNDGAILADVRALLGTARQLRESPMAMDQFYANCMDRRTMEALERVMVKNSQWPDAKTSVKFADMLRQSPVPPVNHGAGRKNMLDVIQHIYTDTGAGDGHAANSPFRLFSAGFTEAREPSFMEKMLRPTTSLWAVSRKEMTAKTTSYFDLLDTEAVTPLWKMPITPSKQIYQDITSQVIHSIFVYPGAWSLFPDSDFFRRSTARTQATHSAIELGIALHRHQLAHHTFPQQLADLVPAYLPELPVDPITGGALHYRLDDKGQPVVYSVGGDRQDDGGYAPIDHAGEDNTDATQHWEDCKVKGDWILWPMSDRPLMKKAK